ncbi:MAG: arginine--tRNA ligase [Candidatus Aenigmarchaeota archaeon]|nr:arginine--tRNA ligase [Candidatus Aenigmarchaeota archaeon]
MTKDVLAALKTAGVKAEASQLEKPPQPEFGEASFPCFPLAKVYKKNPVQIAQEIAAKIRVPKGSMVSKVEARGGYVNFHYDYRKFAASVLSGTKKTKKKVGRVMIEYSQPNPVHPMHIGHARNTLLGDSLANILEHAGNKVTRANYMNNVGLQVAKLVAAYDMWGEGREPEGKPDAWLWKFYIRFHEEAQVNPKLEAEARRLLLKYEVERDKSTVKRWDRIVGWCIDGFKETYKRLGVDFDVYFYEIDYRAPGREIVKKAVKKNIAAKTDEGAVFCDLTSHGIPGTIIQRSDGTGLYITSDLGLSVHKFEKYKLDRSIWVTASDQDAHFQQLFKILEVMGYRFHDRCQHFSYGLVDLPEGKMSSRQGRAVMLDDVMDEMVALADAEVSKRNPGMSARDRKKISGQIAIGALKYAMVRIEPRMNMTFDWDQMMGLEGNTGPYLQYAHTRCVGILRKSGKFVKATSYADINEYEKALIRKLSEFDHVVESAARESRPSMVCNYGFELATVFNSFYHNSQVIGLSDPKQTNFRIALVKQTKDTLGKVFGLVGMEAPEKM